jgi:hypothetical protein
MDPGTSSRHQQLTSGKDTRSARCLERGTPGAGGGPRETTGGNTGTRPRAYLTTAIKPQPAVVQSDPEALASPRFGCVAERGSSVGAVRPRRQALGAGTLTALR